MNRIMFVPHGGPLLPAGACCILRMILSDWVLIRFSPSVLFSDLSCLFDFYLSSQIRPLSSSVSTGSSLSSVSCDRRHISAMGHQLVFNSSYPEIRPSSCEASIGYFVNSDLSLLQPKVLNRNEADRWATKSEIPGLLSLLSIASGITY